MKLAKKISESILFLFLSTIFVQTVFYFVNIKLTIVSLIISILFWLIFDWFTNEKKLQKEAVYALIFDAFIVICCFLYFQNFIETTYDGAFYHGAAMTEMINGWNPVLDQMDHISENVTFWVDYYPKATWIFGAILIKLFNNLSAGMMINFLIMLSTSLYTMQFIFKKSKSCLLSILIALVILFNPIAIEQLHTYYVDAILGNLVILLLMMGSDVMDNYDGRTNFMIFVVSAIMINIKFTGFGFAGIVNLFVWIYFLMKKDRKAILGYTFWGAMMLVIGVGMIGFNPYVINIMEKRHIFFPLAGKDSIDVIEYLIPEQLLGKNPLYKFRYSLLGGKGFIESLKDFELPGYLLFDQQIGAFGPYFSKLIVMCSIGYIYYLVKNWKNKDGLIKTSLLLLAVAVTIIVNYKNVWWVRYAPQIWAFIPIGMLFMWKNKVLRVLAILVACMTIYQNTYILFNTIDTDYKKTLSIQEYYSEYKGQNVTITIRKFVESWDTIDLYWFDAFEIMRSKQFDVVVDKVVHEVDDNDIDQCYHMHAYKLCTVNIKDGNQ